MTRQFSLICYGSQPLKVETDVGEGELVVSRTTSLGTADIGCVFVAE